MRSLTSLLLLLLSHLVSAQCKLTVYDKERVEAVQPVALQGAGKLMVQLVRTPAGHWIRVGLAADSMRLVLERGQSIALNAVQGEGYPLAASQFDLLRRYAVDSVIIHDGAERSGFAIVDKDSRNGLQQQAGCVLNATMEAKVLPVVPLDPNTELAGLHIEKAGELYNYGYVVVLLGIIGTYAVDNESENAARTKAAIAIGSGLVGIGLMIGGNSKLVRGGALLRKKGL